MLYNSYKYCTDEQFEQLKLKLEKLDQTIIKEYSAKIYRVIRADDSDALALNYSVFDDNPYLNNLAIMFNDAPGPSRFEIGVLKAIDIDSIRYYLRKMTEEDISIHELEQNISTYISAVLKLYQEWDKEELLNGEKVELLR